MKFKSLLLVVLLLPTLAMAEGAPVVEPPVVVKPATPIVVKPTSAPAEPKAALKRDMPTPPKMGMSVAEQELPTTGILKPSK